jgi:nucleoid-associated protein YgaU
MTTQARGRYAWAEKVAKEVNWQGNVEERNGKVYFTGTTRTQGDANKIWDAIKTIPEWTQDIVADIKATGPEDRTYTVKSGDTLSKIAKEMLGNANDYMDIFNANKDQMTDPDKIKPGQVLKIPQTASKS